MCIEQLFFSDDDFFINVLSGGRQGFDFRQSGLRLSANRLQIGSGACLSGGLFPDGKAA
jgi:hypothetical protein